MTTKTTHTPGPWITTDASVHGRDICARNSHGMLVTIAHAVESTVLPSSANARLIAMAPRMVDALKTCVEMLEWWASVDGKAPEACYSPDGAWEKARAILRALDTPDAPCPVSPESKEPCPVCGPVKR